MGSLCSKTSNHQGGHVVLGSSNPTDGAAPTSADDLRTASAEAAEQRILAARQRGTGNGKLAAEVVRKSSKAYTEPERTETLRWD